MCKKLWVFMAGILLLIGAAPLRAAATGSITIFEPSPGQTPDDCNQVILEYRIEFTVTSDDGGGKDWVAVTMMDSSGVPLDTDFFSAPSGTVHAINTYEGTRPEPITSRPIIFSLYDIGDPAGMDENSLEGFNFASHGMLMAETTFDPGTLTTNGTCERLPLKSVSLPTPQAITNPCRIVTRSSVVGVITKPVPGYLVPDQPAPDTVIDPGAYWVMGRDRQGKYYLILRGCDFLWVSAPAVSPTAHAPWNGQPLPTQIVG